MSEPERATRWVLTLQDGRWLPAKVDGEWRDYEPTSGVVVRIFYPVGASGGGYGVGHVHDSLEACVASERDYISKRRQDLDASFRKAKKQYNNQSMLLDQREAELLAMLPQKESDE